jgi:sugar phosphate isomerase/epimerase
MDVFALLAEAQRLGVRVLQVCDNLPLANLSAPDLAAFEREARLAKVAIEVGTRGLQPANLLEHLRLAVLFDSPFVRLVVDSPGDEPSPEVVVARLKALVPQFREAGVKLAIENHDRFKAASLVRIVEQAGPDTVGICLDTVNSFGALEGPEVVLEHLAPYALSLHVKDFTLRRAESGMGFILSGSPAGEGRLDLPWLLESLRLAGRDVNAILETWPPPGPTLEETLARERAWVESSVRHLRQCIIH